MLAAPEGLALVHSGQLTPGMVLSSTLPCPGPTYSARPPHSVARFFRSDLSSFYPSCRVIATYTLATRKTLPPLLQVVLVKEKHKGVGRALCRKAEELNASPLILAAHPKNRFEEMLTGSTSKFCVAHCKRPVLLLH